MPIDCVLGTDTPSPSNHSSSPPLDSSEFLVMALQEDQGVAARKRKASNEIPEKPVQKRHRRTKAEIIAARTEMLKKGLKPCSVNTEKVDVTRCETPVRVFQGEKTRMISKNLPRVPRMKFVPKKFEKIDELGFMLTNKGIIYACMTACCFKTHDCATFCNHLIKYHDMTNQAKGAGGKRCHSCGLHTPDGSLMNELKHIRDHVLDENNRVQEILYSKVKSFRQEDSDEDSDAYEDEDEEAVARAPSVCKSETTAQEEETQTTNQEAQGQSDANETAEEQNQALDDGAEQPLDEETSKALEDALVECDMNGLFDDFQQLTPDDPDFDPEQEPQSEEEAVPDEAVTSAEENSEDFYSCEGDNEDQDGVITSDVSRKSRKIRSDRKRAARIKMQTLVEEVYEKKLRRESAVISEASSKDDDLKSSATEAVKESVEEACTSDAKKDSESEDEIVRPTNGSTRKKKTRVHSTEDELDSKRSSSKSSRHSNTTSGHSRHISENESEESTSSEDIPMRTSPILTRRKARSVSNDNTSDSTATSSRGNILPILTRRKTRTALKETPIRTSPIKTRRNTRSTSKDSASDSTGKSAKAKVLNFPARSDSRSEDEPTTSMPTASKRRRKTMVLPSSGSETEIDDTNVASEKNKPQHEKSASSDDDEKPKTVKLEVKTENSGDCSDEYSKTDDDANFLDKMPIDMVIKIRQSITTRKSNLPKPPAPLATETVEEPPEPPVQDASKEHPVSTDVEPLPETAKASADSNETSSGSTFSEMTSATSGILPAAPVPPPEPTPMEENNNDQVSDDQNKVLTEKVLTITERYKEMERKIFKADRRKTQLLTQLPTASPINAIAAGGVINITQALTQLPTARKSTSRILDKSFPSEGTEAYKDMLDSFRVRDFSIEIVRVSLDEIEKKKEPLKIKIVNASNANLASVQMAAVGPNEAEHISESVVDEKIDDKLSETPSCLPNNEQTEAEDSQIDESHIEIIQPEPTVPYDSQEHDLSLDQSVVDLESSTAVTDCDTTVVEATETTVVAKKPAAKPTKSKSTAQVQPPPPEDDVYESLKELYPWITEDIAMKWNKTSSAKSSLMQENCLFSTYKCMSAKCTFFTTDQEAFSAHLEKHRGFDKCFLCSFCLSDEPSPEELIAHYEMRHTKDRYQCNQCMYRSTEKFYCETHQKKYHRNKPKSIYKSPVTILTKTQRSKFIKKQERKLRDAPATVAKVLSCKCKSISDNSSTVGAISLHLRYNN